MAVSNIRSSGWKTIQSPRVMGQGSRSVLSKKEMCLWITLLPPCITAQLLEIGCLYSSQEYVEPDLVYGLIKTSNVVQLSGPMMAWL
ncbi:hypothetical protein AHF37_09442 [Paragonimus kellicotti]|nr:hypothetical protein AHF37_09442 [Paragonimus kellicotti]